MHSIPNRFSTRSLLTLVAGLILFVLMGLGVQLSSTATSPMSGVVIEETLAENRPPAPTPIKPGPQEQKLGWTAWSG